MNEYLMAVTLVYSDRRQKAFCEPSKGVDAESARRSLHQKYKSIAKEEGIEDITVVSLGEM